MAAVDQEPQSQERPPITQLEFRQAMRDFKTMFPEMDEDVIEVVLRSNNGAVDSTIDQLLTMSTDNENERLRTELDATENDELPPCYSPSTPPPSYNQAVPFAQSPAHRTPADSDNSSTPQAVSAKKEPSIESARLPDIVENGEASIAANEAAEEASVSNATAFKLEETTCRSNADVSILDKASCSTAHSSEKAAAGFQNEACGSDLLACSSDVALKTVRHWNPPLLGELPANFLKISGVSGLKPAAKKVTILSSTILQQRIVENERKRQDSTSVNDPELTQYLEDERIALFLQNEEFFQELKDNKEFLSTLERASADLSSPEEEAEATEEIDTNFPYCNNAPPEESDAAFREKIRNMGKVSRKKFTQLAKLFSRRKRRSFKPILGDGSNPSRDNLLLYEDEYSEASDDDSENEVNKKDTWNSHVGGPGGRSQTLERSKMDL